MSNIEWLYALEYVLLVSSRVVPSVQDIKTSEGVCVSVCARACCWCALRTGQACIVGVICKIVMFGIQCFILDMTVCNKIRVSKFVTSVFGVLSFRDRPFQYSYFSLLWLFPANCRWTVLVVSWLPSTLLTLSSVKLCLSWSEVGCFHAP
jgi:hypothetical protein